MMNKLLHLSLTRLFGLAMLLGTLVLTGCASVPMASIEQDTAAKTFVAPSNLSRIYLYRNETFGGAIPMTVSLDKKNDGTIRAQNLFYVGRFSGGAHNLLSY